ncbi:Uncharacterized protein OBRU01_11576, partial [Operophtera brumata]
RKLTPAKEVHPARFHKQDTAEQKQPEGLTAELQEKIAELSNAKLKYGRILDIPRIELANGMKMPLLAIGTALVNLGYRAIDTAYIYGNEKAIGEAIKAKISDGTYSEFDYLDAWFGMEALGPRVRAMGVSNFNSTQIRRVLDRARVKPVVNQ